MDQQKFPGTGFYVPLCNAWPLTSWDSGELPCRAQRPEEGYSAEAAVTQWYWLVVLASLDFGRGSVMDATSCGTSRSLMLSSCVFVFGTKPDGTQNTPAPV